MLEIRAITPNIGAYVDGIDLTQSSARELDALYQAFLEYQVIFVDAESLSAEHHLRLAERFGQLEPPHPFFPNVPDAPQISVIETIPGHAPVESQWHTDLTWRSEPSKGSLLHAQHIPDVGGDTIWCSMTAVFESLDKVTQDKLRKLRAVHSLVDLESESHKNIRYEWQKKLVDIAQANPAVAHPMVQTHPETGKETLYINEQFTRYIEGINRHESQALLNELFARARQPEFQVRYKWKKGALAIWDNRVTQHYAVIDYGDTPRKMHRVTFISK
ncbi:taurine catabolism dioxygenase [Vibrio azureus]|uniref:Taurine dioxygenase n=1 Tax=Vibrio azureus NBRC 104587 TaxID=1219077 RepID=U3A5X4_9VIBR|nr:TauD/TfdA family dioxygenase [Vibrio azureus]AUI86404.1 taurine catabolism dioxygenase [Vibrio azureus]GAD75381.1 taurine dioxygenase [Vibrio azureus NBRC 104587]